MYVRLAFAIAAHLEPEILIVDEVLAVGDQQFQKKCLGKIQDVSQRQGRTVLVVSHTMPVMLQLAQSCVVLDCGSIEYFGPAEKAVEVYLSGGNATAGTVFEVGNTPRKLVGTLAAMIISLRFPRSVPIFSAEEDFRFVMRIRAIQKVADGRVSMTIFSNEGTAVGSGFSPAGLFAEAGEEFEVTIVLPSPRLAPGAYYCGIAVGKGTHKSGHVDFDIVLETLNFEVCAAPGEEAPVSYWCHQWGRIVFDDLALEEPRKQLKAN
jgi:lipopolysaccharide transport system ATP-binding protein